MFNETFTNAFRPPHSIAHFVILCISQSAYFLHQLA
jgi:hypothetical protein